MVQATFIIKFEGEAGNVTVSPTPKGVFQPFTLTSSSSRDFVLNDDNCVINLIGVSPTGGSTSMSLKIDGKENPDSPIIIKNNGGPFVKQFTVGFTDNNFDGNNIEFDIKDI